MENENQQSENAITIQKTRKTNLASEELKEESNVRVYTVSVISEEKLSIHMKRDALFMLLV